MSNILIEAKALSQIKYSKGPFNPESKIELLNPESLNKKFNFTYSESLHGDLQYFKQFLKPETLDLFKKAADDDGLNHEAVLKRLQQPFEDIVLCDMGDEVGHGLFAAEDIPPGTVLFLYAGTIQKPDSYSKDPYIYSLPDELFEDKKESVDSLAISAKKQGGLARFCQHLPFDIERLKSHLEKECLKHLGTKWNDIHEIYHYIKETLSEIDETEMNDIQFASGIREQLATDNVHITTTVINDFPVEVIWTPYGIKKYEQIGFSYGDDYWNAAKIKPRYFFQNGSLIPQDQYRYLEKSKLNSLLFLSTENSKFFTDIKEEDQMNLTSIPRRHT